MLVGLIKDKIIALSNYAGTNECVRKWMNELTIKQNNQWMKKLKNWGCKPKMSIVALQRLNCRYIDGCWGVGS